jgi:hypothetical protein
MPRTGGDPYRELSRLVLNPRGRDIKSETYGSFALAILIDSGETTSLTVDNIKAQIERRFSLTNLPSLIIHQGLVQLEGRGVVTERPGGWILTEEGRKTVGQSQTASVSQFEELLNAIVAGVRSRVPFDLDNPQVVLVKSVFKLALFDVFDVLSRNTAGYLKSLDAPEVQTQITGALSSHWSQISESTIDRVDEIRQALNSAAIDLLYQPKAPFPEILLQIASKHVMWRVLGTDPELVGLREGLLSGAEILLDTNIIVAGIFEGSPDHEQTRWFLEATKLTGSKLAVSEFTVREFNDALRWADELYRRARGSTFDLRIINNEITKTFIESGTTHEDWDAFYEKSRSALEPFLQSWGIRRIPTAKYSIDPESLTAVKGIIREETDAASHPRSGTVLEHDARNILLVQKLREEDPEKAFGSPWFITRDGRLRTADSAVALQHGFPRRSTMSPVTWFELVYPFVWTTVDPKKASEAFSRILASNVAPIPTPSFESFVTYVSRELQIAGRSEEALRHIIQNSHLQRVLQRDVEHGNTAGAVATLQEMFSAALHVEDRSGQKDETIGRLALKVQEYENRPMHARMRFDPAGWNRGLAEVDKPGTPQQKGASLEAFAEGLIKVLPGMRVQKRDLRLEAEEIDLLVSNYGLAVWGDPILVECKNWSTPVGANEVVLFTRKIVDQGAKTGILIVTAGITGDERRDAGLRVREALTGAGVRIIVLTREDLGSARNAETLWGLLEAKYYRTGAEPG